MFCLKEFLRCFDCKVFLQNDEIFFLFFRHQKKAKMYGVLNLFKKFFAFLKMFFCDIKIKKCCESARLILHLVLFASNIRKKVVINLYFDLQNFGFYEIDFA